MPVIFTAGNYPYITLIEDAMGCIHLFEGMETPTCPATFPKVLNKPADVLIQTQQDIDTIKGHLSEDEKLHLAMGCTIQTKNIPPGSYKELPEAFTQLSQLAQTLWYMLNDLQPNVQLSIVQLAQESANDPEISTERRQAYSEIYHYESEALKNLETKK